MKKIGLYEAKTSLSALVAEVEATGKPVALTKHGKVVAELVPPSVSGPKAGMLKSAGFMIADNFDDVEVGFEEGFAEDEALPPRLAKVADDQKKYQA